MKRIILPTDFSDNAWKAMSYAADLYHDIPCQFQIVNTYTVPYSYAEVGSIVPMVDLNTESETQLKRVLNQFKELDHHDLSEFETKAIAGPLVDSIIDIENTFNEQLIIVMGTRGISGVGELFFGTMAATVIKNVKSPVICVPNSAELSTPKKVMLSIDQEGIEDRNEIQPLLDLVQLWEPEIAIVHAGSDQEVLAESSRERIAINQHFSDVKHTFYAMPGIYKQDELTHFAKANKIDLIALIKRDKGFWKNFFHTSLTKNMAFYSDIPLLILRDTNN